MSWRRFACSTLLFAAVFLRALESAAAETEEVARSSRESQLSFDPDRR
jgi:hypothetical protein